MDKSIEEQVKQRIIECKKLGVQSMTILKGIYKSSVDSKGVWKTTFNVK